METILKLQACVPVNDYLAELCELIVSRSEATDGALSDICTQVTDKVSCTEAQIDSYVSTESLLADKNGRQLAASVPQTGKVVVYKAGDTLVSNIRPYFKKIWFAENDGTCSGDVVVFRANNPSLAPYLYAILRSDKFFDYVMSGAKGTKMPRGDKKQMMSYGINPYCPERDQEIIAFAVYGIGASNQENQYLSSLRDSLLPKLMSGEIDTSKVELSTVPNNHLSLRAIEMSNLNDLLAFEVPVLLREKVETKRKVHSISIRLIDCVLLNPDAFRHPSDTAPSYSSWQAKSGA